VRDLSRNNRRQIKRYGIHNTIYSLDYFSIFKTHLIEWSMLKMACLDVFGVTGRYLPLMVGTDDRLRDHLASIAV
jgi:hypothetical protein